MDSVLSGMFVSAMTSGLFFTMPASTIALAPIPILMAKNKTLDRSSYISTVIYSLVGYLFLLGLIFTLFVEIYKSNNIFIFTFKDSIMTSSVIAYCVIINASAKRLNAVGQSRWKAWALSIPLIGPFLILIFQKDPE